MSFRLTNVSVVRLKKGGKRFEVCPCFVGIERTRNTKGIYLDCLLQEQGAGVEEWGVSYTLSTNFDVRFKPGSRESNIDDVLQISNIFVNVSKGEVAKANDLEKSFGISNTSDIVKEVRRFTVNIILSRDA